MSELRIGHAERERAVEQLKTAFTEGRLEQVELEERVGQVVAARTQDDLRPLLADLPVPAAAEVFEVGDAPARGSRVVAGLRAALRCVFCCGARPRDQRSEPSARAPADSLR